MAEKEKPLEIQGFIVEGLKHYFEFFKHMTTVNTGSILLLVTLLDNIFKNPEWKGLVAGSLCLFGLSLIGCLSGMWLTATILAGRGHEGEQHAAAISWIIAISTFLTGIICLVLFSIKNLF